ncbi:MAG: N-acetylmuramoyl-L-alanine amidase [Candidatus Obscuribacterales bacterium]|nr:N-acetylmuramoyl-L-alanine amidase [Candidatus Obscuribacterales bacterium]
MKKRCTLLSGLFFLSSLSACAELTPQTSTLKKSFESAGPKEPVGYQKNGILLVYPKTGSTINCTSTFLIGSVKANSSLFCNGQAVNLSPEGYFAHVVKLSPGSNTFSLTSDIKAKDPLTVTIKRPAPPVVLSDQPLKILPESLSPQEPIGVIPGDIVAFAARVSPGSDVSVTIDKKTIPLKPVYNPAPGAKTSSVKLGMETAFGVSYQLNPATQKDLYLAFYKITNSDHFEEVRPIFTAKNNQESVSQTASGSITVIEQPRLFTTLHDATTVRVGPEAARLTPLDAGIRLLSDGYKGKWQRFLLCPGKHVWIDNADLSADSDSGSLPETKVSTINMESDAYGARVIIPLNQRLPYRIEQELKPNRLVLHLFGATADTDFVTPENQNSDEEPACTQLIDCITWKQKEDLHYELSVSLKQARQWGFFAAYEDTNLVLHIKKPPTLFTAKESLKGVVICLDPGHGGQETGSIGCNGTKEATINLAISRFVQAELEKLGARVIMTRSKDEDVGLAKRVDIAVTAKADLLVSIHNNALPDGRDPNKELGTSSYWYHPQAIELARQAKTDLVKTSGLPDYGCRYQNLALCRPSQMPAILLEVGFMINPHELSQLINPQFQEKIGRQIAQSIRAYIQQSEQ